MINYLLGDDRNLSDCICEELPITFNYYKYPPVVIQATMDINLEQQQIPREWYCPITQEIMQDPVMAADGFTYERKALLDWFNRSKISPVTGLVLANINVIPNHALKHTIEKFMGNSEAKVAVLEQAKKQKKAQFHPARVQYDLPELQLDVDQITDGEDLLVRCRVTPPAQPRSHRNPCSIICILDISESMDTDAMVGGKDVESHGFSRLDLVKHSINTMVEFMEDQDEISLVPFSTSASIALQPTRTTKAGKQLIRQTAKSLETIGTTNIWDGFKVSIDILKQLHQRKNSSNAFVVLLTDGEPNLNPPRGIVPTLVKFLDLEKLPRPNIHVFGYGYELDTSLLAQIAEVGHGTYTYIPDCSMVGTAFVNFMANALSTITNEVKVSLAELNPGLEIRDLPVVGYQKNEHKAYNLGAIQYGQPREVLIRLPIRSFSRARDLTPQSQRVKICNIQLTYGPEQVKKAINASINVFSEPLNEPQMRKTIVRCRYLQLLQRLTKVRKQLISEGAHYVSQFYEEVAKQADAQQSEFLSVLLKELKNPANENQGQVYKAFEKEQWFTKWGRHYIPSLFRAHLMEACTNFKDPALQQYGGPLFEEHRTKMDTIFIKMAPPQPTAKKVEKLVYKPAPVDMSDYYNNYGGCIHEDCLVQLCDGTRKRMGDLRKGDVLKGGAVVECLVQTKVYGWVSMVRVGELIITPWHPIKIAGRWQFPSSCGRTGSMFIESYFNIVLKAPHISIECEGIECIGLGHQVKDDPVASHEYLGDGIVDDLRRSRKWEAGLVVVGKQTRDPQTRRIVGVELVE